MRALSKSKIPFIIAKRSIYIIIVLGGGDGCGYDTGTMGTSSLGPSCDHGRRLRLEKLSSLELELLRLRIRKVSAETFKHPWIQAAALFL